MPPALRRACYGRSRKSRSAAWGQPLHRRRCRILAATNLDIEAAIARNEFREDLYFRLSVYVFYALRERPDDIPVLSDHFLRLLATAGASPRRLSLLPGLSSRATRFQDV